MRILLVNPYYPIDETPSPPLGLAFIAGALEKAGHSVRLLDYVVFPYSFGNLKQLVDNFAPQIVGVTSVTMSFYNAIQVVQDVKAIDPNILTVMGGPHVTFYAEQTLTAYPELDCIVVGEGDITVVEWVAAVANNRPWQDVPGLAYSCEKNVICTSPRELADINDLALPARHLVPLGRYLALGMAISMTSSRGCPFQCIFCVGRKMVGAKVRYRNPVAVVDEMAYLAGLGFHQINMADDLFTANKAHCHGVCDEILKRNLNISWTSFARVDTVSEDVLVKMKAAGCHTVSFGVESGNPEMLKRIRKGITLDQAENAITMCTHAGITPHVSFIIGLPGETPDTLRDTMTFGDRLSQIGAQHGFHILAPFPGTEVRDQVENYDLSILSDDWSQYHANRAIVQTSTVSREMLDDVVLSWEKKYKEYLGNLKILRENGKGTPEEVWPLTRLEHTVYIYDLMKGRVFTEKDITPLSANLESEAQIIDALANHIDGAIRVPLGDLKKTLLFAVSRGYLKFRREPDGIHWNWVDYL